MNRIVRRLPALAACALLSVLCVPPALAQQADECPRLPGDAGLSWTQRGNASFLVCRAIDETGREAFGLYLAERSPFEPRRGNREGRGMLAGQEVRWYRGEVASEPDTLVRETLVSLGNGQLMHVWLHARDPAQLARNQQLLESLRFDEPRFTSN
ncbi:hypothetical protein [Luteimonas abyssi]|uniref:hypothetical protein n=1 Tax=Luteimonas abyssi TaxID=1247514 RepID=UPI000737AD4A|nr:hypothetical protein [Luteimonas abyssi]